ncbi:unnamed protein product, partial [Durusdinium trenchii]
PVRQLEAEPEMERWQLEERKLQAALETLDCTERRVRLGLSVAEPTAEELAEAQQLQ